MTIKEYIIDELRAYKQNAPLFGLLYMLLGSTNSVLSLIIPPYTAFCISGIAALSGAFWLSYQTTLPIDQPFKYSFIPN